MSLKKYNIIKIGLMLAVSLGLIFAVSYFRVSDKYNTLIKKSNVENQLLQSQLSEILIKYDSLKATSQDLSFDTVNSEFEITSAQKKIDLNANMSLDEEIDILRKSIESDQKKSFQIQEDIESNLKALRSLEEERQKLVGYKNQKLTAVNVNARGVKILSDLYTKSRGEKIQQIRVCFTLEGNEFVEKGDKKILIQVVNPRKEVISAQNAFFKTNETKVYYSGSVNTLYNQKDTDVCTYVDLEKTKTHKGKYEVNVFYNNAKIGQTNFEYN